MSNIDKTVATDPSEENNAKNTILPVQDARAKVSSLTSLIISPSSRTHHAQDLQAMLEDQRYIVDVLISDDIQAFDDATLKRNLICVMMDDSKPLKPVAEFLKIDAGNKPVFVAVLGESQLNQREQVFEFGYADYLLLPCSQLELQTRLQLLTPDARPEGKSAATSREIGPPRILFVEDDEFTYDILRTHFEREGWDIVWAKDGEEAERLLTPTHSFDLVLLEANIPYRSGFELLAIMSDQRPASQRPPTVIISSMSQDNVEWKAFELGASDFLSKPFNPITVTSRLKRLLPLAAGVTQ